MCRLSKTVADPTATAAPPSFGPDVQAAMGGLSGLTTPVPQPTGVREVSTKLGSFMKIVAPILQGGLSSVGSAQPTRALGASDFLPSFGGGFERERQREMQMGVMGHQLGLQDLDRQLRLATLQNTIENQRAIRDIRQGNLDQRERAVDVQEGKSGRKKYAVTSGGVVYDPENPTAGGWDIPLVAGPPQTGAGAPLASGGADGAQPSLPTFKMGGVDLPLPPELAGGASQAGVAPRMLPAAGAQPSSAALGTPQTLREQIAASKRRDQDKNALEETRRDLAEAYDKDPNSAEVKRLQKKIDALGGTLPQQRINIQLANQPTPIPTATTSFEDFKRSNPGTAALVEKIGTYDVPIEKVTSTRKGERENMAKLTSMYFPDWDQTQFTAKQAARKEFEIGGTGAKNIRSLNTSVAHLDSLQKAANDLANSPIPLWNMIANKGITAVGDPRVTKFNAAATAVQGELATVFKGTSGTDQEINQWRNQINASQSPAQLRGNIDELIGLMAGRLNTVQAQYRAAVGKRAKPILNDSSRGILSRIGGKAQDMLNADVPTAQGASPQAATTTAAPAAATQAGERVRTWNPQTRRLE